jgi:hypothetical protein
VATTTQIGGRRRETRGERATQRALRPLTRSRWTLIDGALTGRGHHGHVLVGPAGVFLLESRSLSGTLTVEDGVLRVRWRDDPDDAYENPRLAARIRARAADLAGCLRAHGIVTRVQPVVVLWGGFDDRPLESERIAWVRGGELADYLAALPPKLTDAVAEHAARALA